MILRSVVLPHPLGPRMTRVLPSGILRFRFRMENADPRPGAGTRSEMVPVPIDPEAALSRSPSVLQTSIRSIRAMIVFPPLAFYSPRSASRGGSAPSLAAHREREHEGRACPHLALDPDPPAVQLDE